MDALIPLLLIGILTIPVLIVILLIVYIAKTNKLSRSTSALEADLAALRREVARLNRASAPVQYHGQTALEATPASADSQAEAGSHVKTEPPLLPPIEAEAPPPPVPTAPHPHPSEPQVYVSPFRPQVPQLTASGGAPAQSSNAAPDGAVKPEPAPSRPGAQARPLNLGSHNDQARPERPSRSRAEWESMIGGRFLNWIGALATIIGIGFFLRYAFQNNWITPSLRVGIGAIAGFALLAVGDLSFRKGYQLFSQGLVGAGISVLYLSTYASFSYYHLEGQQLAFLLMSAVTILTFVQAFRFDSLSVSLLGWAGGFLTPVLLSTGQANEVALFAYISILDAGLLAVVALKQNWVVLQPLTLVATYLTYAVWYGEFYSSADFPTTAIFLTIFWTLFHALDVGTIIRSPWKYLELREIVAGSNTVFYYAALYAVVDPDHHDYIATVTLGLGAVYLVTIAALRGLHPPKLTEARFALTGAILLVIATALRFTGFDTVFCWSMEALALVLAAVYWKEPGVLGGAIALYLAAVVRLLAISGWYSYGTPESFVPLLNRRALAFLGLAAAGALGAEAIRRADRARHKAVATAFDYSWCLVLFVLLAVETGDEFGHLMSNGADREWLGFVMYLAIGVVWMAYGVLLALYGARRRIAASLNVGLFVAAVSTCTVAVAGFSYEPIRDFNPIVNIRTGAFAAVLVGLLVLLRSTRDWAGESWPRWAHRGIQAVFCLMIFVFCTAETRDYFDKILDPMRASAPEVLSNSLDEALRKYTNLQQVALSLVWLVYSILLIGYGIWRRILSLRIIAIIIFGIAILKIFIYDLSFLETLYRIFSFIGLGLILLSVSFLYQRFKSAILESGARPQPES